MTELYEQINNSIAAVGDWSLLVYQGVILSKKTLKDFDTLIDSERDASDWNDVAKYKRFSELAGYSSLTIDSCVKDFLTNMPMFTNYKVPKTNTVDDYFGVDHDVLHGFRWSKELNYETTKWDAQDCRDGLYNVLSSESDCFYRCNPDTGVGDQVYGGRMYEKNQTARCFWELYKDAGVLDAKSDVKQCWAYMQNNNWLTDHYTYAPNWNDWVWDGLPELVQAYGRFHVHEGNGLSNWSRVYADLGPRYLDDKWNSKQWKIDGGTVYKVVVHHNPGNSERRLGGTTLAYVLCHQYYDQLSDTQKSNFQDMLKGTTVTQGWQALISTTAGLFDSATDKFRYASGKSTSDGSTANGCITLMLLGVCPDTGFLAFPLETTGLGTNHMISPKGFRWDGDNKKIRISVYAGKLTFMYGSSNVDYTFPRDGVYQVYFSDDYTSIKKAVQIGGLPGDYYLEQPTTYHTQFQRIYKAFKNRGYAQESMIRRKLVLSAQPNDVTGWYSKSYVDYTIEGLVPSGTVSHMALNPGFHSTASFPLYTAYELETGDQIVYNCRYYEVKTVEEISLGPKLMCYKAQLEWLPFYRED